MVKMTLRKALACLGLDYDKLDNPHPATLHGDAAVYVYDLLRSREVGPSVQLLASFPLVNEEWNDSLYPHRAAVYSDDDGLRLALLR